MSDTQTTFIQLNRRFRRLDVKSNTEDVALDSYTRAFWPEASLSWDDLLKQSRVVILGEPGSGKTWEMREKAAAVTRSGEFGLYIRLDHLVNQPLETLLGPEDFERFKRWKKSRRPAFFFLDSVDEAKFQRIADFYGALGRLQAAIGKSLIPNARIFLSSRVTEWNPESDSFEFRSLFPTVATERRTNRNGSSTEDEPQTNPFVVHLEPMDKLQVECYAKANQLSDVDALVNALDHSYAWEFARRPLDVSQLIEFWKAKKKIGSLTELIEYDITTKLRPRRGRDEYPLSDARAREGAEWMAATNFLTRKFTFSLLDSDDTSALNPKDSLPAGWPDNEIRALINRALFDGATYGRFRFHHRRVTDYLAATWITARMREGCPEYELERILAEKVRGGKILRPSLIPITAWLCNGEDRWNESVRRVVLESDPGVHLRFGDPAGLSLDYREKILRSMAKRSRGRGRMWIDSERESCARLAHPGISPLISDFVLDRTLSVDFRIELLDIVRFGRLIACLEATLRLVSSPEEPDSIKSHAVAAINANRDENANEQLKEAVKNLPHLSNRLCARIVEGLYPGNISALEMMDLLEKTDPVRRFTTDIQFYLRRHFESAVTPAIAGELLDMLVKLATKPPLADSARGGDLISEQFYWVGDLFPLVLNRLLSNHELTISETETAATACYLFGRIREHSHHDREDAETVNDATLKHLSVRRKCLWLEVDEFRRVHRSDPISSAQIFGYWEILKSSREDFFWLLDDIRERKDDKDKLLALQLAMEVWHYGGRLFSLRRSLKNATKNDAALRKAFRASVLASPFFPLKLYWNQKIRLKYSKFWWRRKIESVASFLRWIREQCILWLNLKELKSGARVGWLVNLTREADQNNTSQWTTTDWRNLQRKRGKIITRATKRGCEMFWRGHRPPLPHENPTPNQTSFGTIVGLTGLQLELSVGESACRILTDQDAELATRYALNEMNGFPSWLPDLARVKPQQVGEVFWQCIEAEWILPTDSQGVHQVLYHLAWHGEDFVQLIYERIFRKLQIGDPPNSLILRMVLAILMSKTDPPFEALSEIAAKRSNEGGDMSVKVLWLSVLFQIDGERGISQFAKIVENSRDADDVMVRLCSVLSGQEMEKGPYFAIPSYLRAKNLRRFIPLVFAHIRTSEDVNRAGAGAYTPTARDNAQGFRSVLLDQLAKSNDNDAGDALLELVDESSLSQMRDWILKLIDDRAERDADLPPWAPHELREFANKHELNPKNDSELFAIAVKRLLDLKRNVEQVDNSSREELRQDDRESRLRRWLQRKLFERSNNRYTVPQESEIDLEQRPDLRVENPITGPVSIEIKWAESWTIPELVDGLESQLVGQYLRSHNSNYGIYILGAIGKKQNWKDPISGEPRTFEQVTELIRRRAAELAQQNPKIRGLEVLSIDFRRPH